MVVGLIEEYDAEKFKDRMEQELKQLSESNLKIDVKYSTCVTDKGILYSAMIITLSQ